MMNQLYLVGRLVKDPEVKVLDNGKEVSNICLAVQRPYKNDNGEYDTDFFDCSLWGNIAKATSEYCNKGEVIGVRGRLGTSSYEDKETGKTIFKIDIIAEKVTFLSSKSKNEIEPDR